MSLSNVNWPTGVWQWDPAYGPNESTRRWRSLTSRAAAQGVGSAVYSVSYGRQYELAQVETGTAGVQIDNIDEALTPGNLSSPYQVIPGWQYRQSTNTIVAGLDGHTLQFAAPVQAGSIVFVAVVGTAAATSVGAVTGGIPPWAGKSFQQLASVNAGGYYLSLWASVANQGGNVLVQTNSTGTWTAAAMEYVGAASVANLDVTATTTLTGGSYTSVGTGTTAAATAGDLLIVAAAPANYAAASTPTAPSWSASTQRVSAVSPGSGTAANNSLVFLGDRLDVTAGAKSDTASWTNAAGTALGMAVTIKVSTTTELITPPTGSMAVIPYRPLRHWAMWPPVTTATGNLLNSTNDQWAALGSVSGSYADTAGFEGGTTGTWSVGLASSIANSTTRAHDGTHSMVVTWPTASSGASYVSTDLPPVETGYTYTISAWVWVPAANPAVRLRWGGTNGTASSTTAAWERISVTVTRADAQDDRLYLATAAGSTAGQQVWVDSVQLEISGSATTFTTTGTTEYPLHSGFIERYPETWTQNGYYGWQGLTSVDPLALLAALSLSDCMTEDILQDSPAFYWPLSDVPASAPFCLPYGNFYGLEWINNYYLNVPSAPTDYTMGATGGPGVDSIACVQFSATGSSQPSVWFGPGFYSGPTYAVNDTGAGVTWELWFQTTSTNAAVIAEFIDDAGPFLDIELSAAGVLTAVSYDASAVARYTITDNGKRNDGLWHYVAVTETASGSTVTGTLQVDNVVIGTGTYTGTVGMQTAQLGLAWGWDSTTHPFAGKLARVAVYATALSTTRRFSHWASAQGFPWDTTGARETRVLGWMPWSGAQSISTGITQVSTAAGLSGRTVQDVINECQSTENAPFLATPVGVLTQVSRDTYYLAQTPAYTFGENVSGGETPYTPDVSAGTDITYIANQVTVTGASGKPQQVTDPVSQVMFGPRTLSVTTNHDLDSDALLLAQHLLGLYRMPHQRVISVVINPATYPSIWPVALGIKLGDRVRFNRRTSAGVTLTFDGFVDRVQPDVGVGSWLTRLQISPADPIPPFILGDATYGVLGQNVLKY